VLTSFVITVVPVMFQSEMPRGALSSPLDRTQVNFLDRPTTYYHSQTALNLSHIWTAGLPVIVATASLRWGDKKWAESIEDMFLITEAVALTTFTNQVVRYAFQRPRPYLYQLPANYPVSQREELASFFSGHAATTFTLGIAY
jgi:hypothetical protein